MKNNNILLLKMQYFFYMSVFFCTFAHCACARDMREREK